MPWFGSWLVFWEKVWATNWEVQLCVAKRGYKPDLHWNPDSILFTEAYCMTAVDVLGCWGLVLIGVGGRYGADRGFTVGWSTSVMGLRAAQALLTAVEVKDESKPVWREIWRGWWATLRVKWVQRERALRISCVYACVCRGMCVCHMGLRGGTFSKHIKLKHSSVSILPAICVNACRKYKASVLTSDRKMYVGQWQISVSTIQKYKN